MVGNDGTFIPELRTPNLVPLLAINWGKGQFGLHPGPPADLGQGDNGNVVPLPAYLPTCISSRQPR